MCATARRTGWSRPAWDNVERIEHSFSTVFHCDDNGYTRAVSRNFWISLIARTYDPGCKLDNMIILEGAQGALKSSALNMIGGEWFAEQHENATNAKAFAEVLQGKLLIEIAEMDAFSRAEVTRVKQVVSNKSDRYRPSYGRHAQDHPRRCVMAGSTNKDDWNRDATGARRFWPIACKGFCDLGYLKEHRAQLFAEAVGMGESWQREALGQRSKGLDAARR
jgi:predicted P-loop ATPase